MIFQHFRIVLRRSQTLSLVAFALAMIGALASCGDFDRSKQGDLAAEKIPSAVIYHFTSYGYHNGKREWYLQSEKAEVFSLEKKTIVYKFTLYHYDEQGRQRYQISSDTGTLFDETQDIYLSGNVVAENDEQTVLKTETLKYSKKEKLVTTPDPVRVERPNGDVLLGTGMRADMGFKKIELLANVRGIRN